VLANQTYIIGFSSFHGTAGRLTEKKYNLQKPKPNSFETWINPTYNYAFIDYAKYNIADSSVRELFFMAGSIKGKQHTSHQTE